MIAIHHKKNSLLKRWLLILILILTSLLVVFIGLFNFYKDDIARNVLLRVNNIQTGELVFNDISFDPFVHFPNISLLLSDVNYFEYMVTETESDSNNIPIIELDKVFIAFDIIDLVKGHVNISDILLENGKITLISYVDSSLNITNPFVVEVDSNYYSKKSSKGDSDFDLNLGKIALRNINVYYHQLSNHNFSRYSIHSIDASLEYSPDKIKCFVSSNVTIDELEISKEVAVADKNIQIETTFAYDRALQKVKIEPSKFIFEKSNFTMSGNLGFMSDGNIDMVINGDDKDLSILNLLLPNNLVQNINQGKILFNATIQGKIYKGIPQIECNFAVKDVVIGIPNTMNSVSDLNIEGIFKSGNKKDFSDANLEIKKIAAKLPGGNLDATVSIRDFHSPIFDIDFNMKTELNGFDIFFNLDKIDSLNGSINVVAKIAGKFDPVQKQIIDKIGNSTINCNNISFVIPGVNKIKKVNGIINFNIDTTYFENFSLEIGSSDFNIVGSLSNIFYLLLDVNKDIEGNLHIISNTYDFPDFFRYDKRVARSFPYRFNNVSIDVGILTSTSSLTDFIVVPKIDFNIHHLVTEIEDFMPRTVINSGLFTLGEIDSALNLNFANFNLSIAGSKLSTNVVYNSPPVAPDWLTVDLNAVDLNPQETFVYWTVDSISNSFNGKMDAQMHLDLVFSLDTIDFDKVNFTAHKLSFINTSDTFAIQKLNLEAKHVYYNLSTNNILEKLDCEIDMSITDISTTMFNINELEYGISVKTGVFSITPKNKHLFSEYGDGLFVLKPFDVNPTYDLKYKVNQFDVANLFSTFLEDTLVVGKMNFDLSVSFSGLTRHDFERSLNGRLLVDGKNLTLYGLDLDETIERFKRSQKFTFADVGAVLLMGPAGILVTKGSDYASLIALNNDKSCKVMEVSSSWEVVNGLVKLDDVAFTTNDNRMAAKGWLNLLNDSLNIEIALLNNKGCSIYSQPISGKIHNPDMGKLKVVKSLLAPVTNLVKNVGDIECDVFYNGSVKQPLGN